MIADMPNDEHDVVSMLGMSVERIDSFITLLSLTTTHDIVPDDQKQSVVLSLESAIRRELQSIVAQQERLTTAEEATASA